MLVQCFILFGTYNFPEPPVGRALARPLRQAQDRHVGLKADLHFEQAMFRHPSIVKRYTSWKSPLHKLNIVEWFTKKAFSHGLKALRDIGDIKLMLG